MSEAAEPKAPALCITKGVTIAEPESISPTLESIGEDQITINASCPRQHRASIGKRLSGRPSINPSSSAQSLTGSPQVQLSAPDSSTSLNSQMDPHSQLLSQVTRWLNEETSKLSRSSGSLPVKPALRAQRSNETPLSARQSDIDAVKATDTDLALQKLERILLESSKLMRKSSAGLFAETQGSYFPRRKSSARKLRKNSTIAASSDTEYQDGDALVPSVDFILDNSKTMSFSGGNANSGTETVSSKRAVKEKDGWNIFKYEIVRLTHTLKLKGWRHVPLDRATDIEVKRLSGALTNAVYVVLPPKSLPDPPGPSNSSTKLQGSKRTPPKLLLRVYGPQVEHLIDRESELQILRRLARKKIGPRLLGTFDNGRFEQFFNAKTLTAEDLRIPETSKQIAKRMRELHDGIELLESERDAGPFVWQNWDKWVSRCGEVISWLDEQILALDEPSKGRNEAWKSRGLVCGVEWATFRTAVDNYRKWLDEQYGGKGGTRSQLVFAHNDTQYGNLLRIEPSGESPLLLPANEHKQLVVIDFEYANANTPGLEFANHFTEWCYNYHSPNASYVCNTNAYPTPAEQKRFLTAYVQHVPGFATHSPSATPSSGPASSISTFMLDSRAPPAQYDVEEKAREARVQRDVEWLSKETRLWRVANSAQWVAWGIVQAKVPGMNEALEIARKKKRNLAERLIQKLVHRSGKHQDGVAKESEASTRTEKDADENNNEEIVEEAVVAAEEADEAAEDPHVPHEHEIDDEPEFDYLAYAQERALFFWGDLLELGLVKEGELPEFVRKNAKRVAH